MKNIKFQATKHQKLWKAMRNSWYLVKKFGITDTKIYLRRSILQDYTDIFNSCYACEYDLQVAKSKKEHHSCKYCPIHITRCGNVHSTLFQMSVAIQSDNPELYKRMCLDMANSPVKLRVEFE